MRYLITLFILSLMTVSVGAAESLHHLQVDFETTPNVVENTSPEFAWQLGSGKQKKYLLNVISASGASVWASGIVESDRSVGISYSGKPLNPTTRYEWVVTVWDEQGVEYQGRSWFETGFMEKGDKAFPGAKWIGGDATDQPFWSNYLTVFKLNFDVQLDKAKKATHASFLMGGNDPRLLDKNFNTQGLANQLGESYIALELSIKKLIGGQGNAELNIYRKGFSKTDKADQPMAVLQIPANLINKENLYDAHTIHLESTFGLVNIYVNGHEKANRVTPFNEHLSLYIPQGLSLNPMAFGGSRIPTGNPGDALVFPALASIGFEVKSNQAAFFSNIEIKNYREPSNLLFAAGKRRGDQSSKHYAEIFIDSKTKKFIKKNANGSYHVAAKTTSVVVMKDPSRLSAPMLRTEFNLPAKKVVSAKIYATARGIYELYVNGKRVGEDYFTPGLTQYNKHHPYQAYDVTGMLQTGKKNALGIWLSEGWWSGNITYTGSNWNYFGDRQSFLGKLIVKYSDGSQDQIDTDPKTWQVFMDGPIRYSSLFQGEVYDARLEKHISGWNQPGYKNKQWRPAVEVSLTGSAFIAPKIPGYDNNELIHDYNDMELVGHQGINPKVVDVLTAKSVNEVRPGVYVYDMGQNMVGVPHINLGKTKKGQQIVLRFAEVLYPNLPQYGDLAGILMTENLRAAMVQDIFIAKGGEDSIRPRFTFHGYRYLEIAGIDKALPLADVQGAVVSSIKKLDASYETSNAHVNKLWQNITWSMRSNFLSIPTDTPARNERMGWSGDLNVFAETSTLMSNVNPFLRRHMTALEDIQGANGRFPDVAPIGGGFGGILWGSVGVHLPWMLYQQYGDVATLKKSYPSMKRYTDYLWAQIDPATGIMLNSELGDWLSPEGRKNDPTLLWEAYHLHVLNIMAKSAELVGKSDDAKLFSAHYEERKEFFNRTYVDAKTGKTIHSGVVAGFMVNPARVGKINPTLKRKLVDTQASYAIAIAMNAFDERNLANAMQNIKTAVLRENTDDSGVLRPTCSLMTGFIGTASLMPALSQSGHNDAAYCLLQQMTYPSWLYSVVNGSTTIWERLNSYTKEEGFGDNNTMNSFNHYSFGAVGAWMINYSLGIQADKAYPAYKRIILKPTPDPTGKMTWAKGHFDSPHGRIASGWKVSESEIIYEVEVPGNTSAVLYIGGLNESKLHAHTASGVNIPLSGFSNGMGQFDLKPGKYKITALKY
jgi:alpha-L-rhamnosidase